jgi:hypothetical protein
MVATRVCKALLLAAMGFFFLLVVFNNITDFDSNYQFVRHVLMMDSTFPGNRGMWRAISSPAIHLLFYGSIIAWEVLNAVLCWCADVRDAAVVSRVPVRGRGVVSDVAVEDVERPGGGLPHVCDRGGCAGGVANQGVESKE